MLSLAQLSPSLLLYPVSGQQLDALKISNVSFPFYNKYTASTLASYQDNITEFTICYRFQIESFNDRGYIVVDLTSIVNFFMVVRFHLEVDLVDLGI